MGIVRKEVWKAIPGFEGFYEVSNRGAVRRLERMVDAGNGPYKMPGAVLKISWERGHYPKVSIRLNAVSHTFGIHRLVMLAFVGPKPKGMNVNHKDGNKLNNRVENLEYVTFRENTQHAIRNGLMNTKGSRNGSSKLKEKDVLEIRKLEGTGMSLQEVAKQYGVSEATICNIYKRKKWKHI